MGIVPEVKMKKPEVYRKMYTGAEMYRNERQERLSQQMDKLNSDFIKMLYAGGEQAEDPFDFDDLPTPPPRTRRNRRRVDSDSSDSDSDSEEEKDALKQAKTKVEELKVNETALLRAAAEAELKAEREKKREDINKKLGKSLLEDGNSGSSSKTTRIQYPNSKTQLDDEPEEKPTQKAEPKPIQLKEPEKIEEVDSAIESESSSLRSSSSESSFESESKEVETEDFGIDEDTEDIEDFEEEQIKEIVFPSNPLGMENRLIADNQIVTTDSFSHYKACYARLNGDVCWIADMKPCAKSNT